MRIVTLVMLKADGPITVQEAEQQHVTTGGDGAGGSSGGASSAVELLVSAINVSHLPHSLRCPARQWLVFASKMLAARTPPGMRQSLCQQGFRLHAYHDPATSLICFAATDIEYPEASVFCVVDRILDEFLRSFPWFTMFAALPRPPGVTTMNIPMDWPCLTHALDQYNDPANVDTLRSIQRDLELTRHVVHQTIHSVLERGETLDSLVERSADLNIVARVIYQKTKDRDNCCSLA